MTPKVANPKGRSRPPISLASKAAPAKAAHPRDKYFLRTVHQEIDLYDRKLAHLTKFEEFADPAERKEAEAKLQQKRTALEKTARELAAAGIEFSEAELPRSFRVQSDPAKSGDEGHRDLEANPR